MKANQLDRVARRELTTLSKDNADGVARHLVMAGRLIDDDPELAHRHALSASRRAGRVAVVRETVAITAYAIGDFALALRELRTRRRISGSDDLLPLMVDSERGVGRPDRALELGRSVDRSTLPVEVRVSLAIAMSGARLDQGQAEAALGELEIPELDRNRAFEYSPALFDAYAEVLGELGRDRDAAEWRRRAVVAAEALGDSDAQDEEIEVIEVENDEREAAEEAAGESTVTVTGPSEVAAAEETSGSDRIDVASDVVASDDVASMDVEPVEDVVARVEPVEEVVARAPSVEEIVAAAAPVDEVIGQAGSTSAVVEAADGDAPGDAVAVGDVAVGGAAVGDAAGDDVAVDPADAVDPDGSPIPGASAPVDTAQATSTGEPVGDPSAPDDDARP